MMETKPSLADFKNQIENLFGQELTEPACVAAEAFWNNWSEFNKLISNEKLSIQVDTPRLGKNFPEYGRHNTWKGVGIVLIIAGLIAFWFLWQLGVTLLLIGIGAYYFGNRVKHNDAQQFSEKLIKEAELNPTVGGCTKLCAHYIAGTIQLVSNTNTAHWAQYPSNVITGDLSFIDTSSKQQRPTIE